MADILIPKGYTSEICKNERARSVVGGEVSITVLRNPENNKFVMTVEDHVEDTKKIAGPFSIRELDIMKDIINDVLWKARVK